MSWKSCDKCGTVTNVEPTRMIGWNVYGDDKWCKCGNQIQFKPNKNSEINC